MLVSALRALISVPCTINGKKVEVLADYGSIGDPEIDSNGMVPQYFQMNIRRITRRSVEVNSARTTSRTSINKHLR
jgi:hypothetical protein